MIRIGQIFIFFAAAAILDTKLDYSSLKLWLKVFLNTFIGFKKSWNIELNIKISDFGQLERNILIYLYTAAILDAILDLDTAILDNKTANYSF